MKKNIILDSFIIAICILGCFLIPDKIENSVFVFIGISMLMIIIVLTFTDIIKMLIMKTNKQTIDLIITELVLLSEEEEKPIQVWEMQGRTSLLIGKDEKEHPVDIDLRETEYSALIDDQHAVLNYAGGDWYIEDLYSNNGIRIRKKEDGVCYQIAKEHPCKLAKGDILLIANTKLLLR